MDLSEVHSAYVRGAEKAHEDIGRVNVLVAGISGVGKSTLVNAVLDARLAPPGTGESVTKTIDRYTSPGSPIAIYDTRGFEIRDAARTVNAVREKIRELRCATDPNEQIHIAWLCIQEQSHRIEPVHTSFLEMLKERQVPAIVVLTQAFGEREMLDATIRLAVPNSGVIPVMAETRRIGRNVIETYGVGELVEHTLRLLPEAQRLAFISAQNARWDLKEEAVRRSIRSAVTKAGVSAVVPGHSLILLGLQIELIAEINAILQLKSHEAGGKEYWKGLIGLMAAKIGGTAAFGLALSEVLKVIPGLGSLGAAVLGGTIGATVTHVLGNVYFDSVKEYAQNDLALPSQEELIERMTRTLENRRNYYAARAERDAMSPQDPS